MRPSVARLVLVGLIGAFGLAGKESETIADSGYYIGSALYSDFKVTDLPVDAKSDHAIFYRLFLRADVTYKIDLVIRIDPRINLQGPFYWYQYHPSSNQTIAEFTVHGIREGSPVLLASGSEQVHRGDVHDLLLFLGRNEVFSLPYEMSEDEPIHHGAGVLGGDWYIFLERSHRGVYRKMWRPIYPGHDSIPVRTKSALMHFIDKRTRCRTGTTQNQ